MMFSSYLIPNQIFGNVHKGCPHERGEEVRNSEQGGGKRLKFEFFLDILYGRPLKTQK